MTEAKPASLAARVMDFEHFQAFLEGADEEGGGLPYSLERAAEISGIPLADLTEAVRRLAEKAGSDGERPKVAILYEKGMIWGFNYHNTAAVASLGLLLGRYGRPGRLTGRVGGHQKGWAENDAAVAPFKGSASRYPRGRDRDAGNSYSDRHLRAAFANDPAMQIIPVKHNLDNHVFGPTEDLHSDQLILSNDGRSDSRTAWSPRPSRT